MPVPDVRHCTAYGDPRWIAWIEKTADTLNFSPGALFDQALRVYAASTGLKPPPIRLDRKARRRRSRRATTSPAS
jgi:hypothetical protein